MQVSLLALINSQMSSVIGNIADNNNILEDPTGVPWSF